MSGPSRPVYLDSTVLSNLALTDSVGILLLCFADPIVPETVLGELMEGSFDGHDHLRRAMNWIEDDNQQIQRRRGNDPTPPRDLIRRESATASNYPPMIDTVDPGEAAVLRLAHQQDGVAATDDRDARDVADSLGVDTTGSLGVLAKAVHIDEIDVETADRWLSEWVEYGYYSPVDSVSELL